MHQEVIMAMSIIGITAFFCQWFAWWIKLPAILLLLLAGMVLGPLLGWLEPDRLFGDLLLSIVSLSVSIILFEGSLTLKLHEIKELQAVVRNMLTIGVMLVWLITALSAWFFLGFHWKLSLLFGAIMVVTGPTVIAPMLRTVRPNARISSILRWEGIMIDPLGAILGVLVFEFLISGQSQDIVDTLLLFGRTLLVGTVLGSCGGYFFGLLLRHHLLPEYLHNVAALTLVFAVFGVSNELSEESGLLTVTVMGIWLANMKGVSVEGILDFKESLSVLLISGLFILLAARLEFDLFKQMGLGAVGVFLSIQFIARPVKVLVSTCRSALTWQEKATIAWIGPRGIVAAAVSAPFAIRLQQSGFEQAPLLVPLVFTIIIGTVLLQSASAKFIADALGVAEPDNDGFLIVGANPVARLVAQALNDIGIRTRLADSSWENVSAARMLGLDTYYGNAVSEHADRYLDLVGIGNMLALTPHNELNSLACLHYQSEFGVNNVYTLATGKEHVYIKMRVNVRYHARILFGEAITYAKLASLVGRDATIHHTPLTEDFDYTAYQLKYGRRSIPLFALTDKDELLCFTADDRVNPEPGWTILALVCSGPDSPSDTKC
ncbi:MAG: cation:proton antiporter [Gammaproteobacteria bacterium]